MQMVKLNAKSKVNILLISNCTFLVHTLRGISDELEFGRDMVRILARRDRAKIPIPIRTVGIASDWLNSRNFDMVM